MVGYLAIAMAVLSPPIVRLCDTWSNIRADLYHEIAEFGGEAMGILERRRLSGNSKKRVDARILAPKDLGIGIHYEDEIPYFGDLLHCLDDAHASPRSIFSKSIVFPRLACASSKQCSKSPK